MRVQIISADGSKILYEHGRIRVKQKMGQGEPEAMNGGYHLRLNTDNRYSVDSVSFVLSFNEACALRDVLNSMFCDEV